MAQVVTRRDRRSITTLNDQTGVYSLDSVHVPLHYESALDSGDYDTAIDCTPVRVDVPAFDGWRVEVNGWHYALGQPEGWADGVNGFGGRKAAHWFLSRLVRAGAMYWPTRTWHDAGGAPDYDRANLSTTNGTVAAGGETFTAGLNVEWTDLWNTPNGGAIDARWRVTGDGLKEEIVVDALARANLTTWIQNLLAANPGYTAANLYFGFVFKVDWSDIPALKSLGDTVDPSDFTSQVPLELRDALDRLLAYMPLGDLIVRNNGNPDTRVTLHRRLWSENGDYFLLVGASIPEINAMPAGALIFDPTIDTDIDTGYDDAYQQGAGTTYASETITYVRCSTNTTDANWRAGGMRFALAGIPSGATVTAAYVTGNVISDYDDPQCIIYCEDIDNAADYNTNPYVWNTTYRVRTTANVDWHTTGIGFGDQNTPSLISPVQEVIDRAGWSAGNYINFIFIPDSGSTYQLRYWAYEHGSNWEQVHIEYTVAADVAVTVGAIAAAGRAATISPGGVAISASAGVSDTAGQGGTVVPGSVSMAATAGVADTAGQAATITPGGVTTSATAATADTAGQSAAIAVGGVAIAVTVGATDTAGQSITLATGPISVPVTTGTADTDGQAATIQAITTIPAVAGAADTTGQGATIIPGASGVDITAATMDSAGQAAAVAPGAITVVVSDGALTALGYGSTVASGAVAVDATTGAGTLAGQAATINLSMTVDANTGSIASAGLIATVAPGTVQVNINTATITAAAYGSTVSPGAVQLQAVTGALDISGQGASVQAGGVIVAALLGALSGAGQNTIVAPGNVAVTAATGPLAIDGQVISVIPGNVSVVVTPATLAALGQAASMATGPVAVSIVAATVDSSGQTAIITPGAVSFDASVGGIASVAYSGSIQAGAATITANAGIVTARGWPVLLIVPGIATGAVLAVDEAGSVTLQAVDAGGVVLDAVSVGDTVLVVSVSGGVVLDAETVGAVEVTA